MAAVARVLLLTDPGMAVHRPPGHPERPERLDAVSAGVADGAAAGRGGGWIGADTFLGADSMTAARLAVGATAQAAAAVLAGRAQVAFAVVPPPGPHAAAGPARGGR